MNTTALRLTDLAMAAAMSAARAAAARRRARARAAHSAPMSETF